MNTNPNSAPPDDVHLIVAKDEEIFLGLLAWLAWTITERMGLQRMTVFDMPMSYVYGGVAFGCLGMFVRQMINLWRNARIGWSRPDDVTHQIAAD